MFIYFIIKTVKSNKFVKKTIDFDFIENGERNYTDY